MKILIAVASKHGSTREIADVIAEELRTMGHVTDVHAIDEVDNVAAYDAAVIGSAVYLGNWLGEARRFVEDHGPQLSAMPVWLFSSGPIIFPAGSDGQTAPEDEPEGLLEASKAPLKAINARDHRVFGGKLDRHQLNLAERFSVRLAKASDGDYRRWDEIRNWARGIATALPGVVEVAPGP